MERWERGIDYNLRRGALSVDGGPVVLGVYNVCAFDAVSMTMILV